MNASHSDKEYWSSSQAGFGFDDAAKQPQSGWIDNLKIRDKLDELSLPSLNGLSEAAENTVPEKYPEISPSQIKHNVLPISSRKFSKASIGSIGYQKVQTVCVSYEPRETVEKMILGDDYSLVHYKKQSEKLELLQEAVKSCDGNIILEVLLFLRDTLKKSIFQRELIAHPEAANVYLAYLEEIHEIDELSNILLLLGKFEDAAICKYGAAVSVENPERKLKLIENCLSSDFHPGATNQFYQQSVEEEKLLLSEQFTLKNIPVKSEKLSLFEELCNKRSVVDLSVLSTIIYCYVFFYKTDEEKFAIADRIKINCRLSKKQFMWAALRALSISHRWQDIDSLFISKNWLSSQKLLPCIPISKILEVFSKAEAPSDVMNKYISCIDNEEERLEFAQKYGCHSIAIQVFKNNKDRQGLIKYQSCLEPHSLDFLFALKVLNDRAIKWKK